MSVPPASGRTADGPRRSRVRRAVPRGARRAGGAAAAAVDLAWLADLCRLPGVSGDEGAVREAVWARVRRFADEAWVDPLGTLVVRRGWDRGPGPRVVLAAHLDEVGLIVTGIDESGLLRFRPVGACDPRVLPGCMVGVGPSGLAGAVVGPPPHVLSGASRRRPADPADLRIDIGATNRSEAAVRVRPGVRAAFRGPAGALGRLFRAKALDDRAGVAALAAVLEALRPDTCGPLAVAFTVLEEVGARGAAAVARGLGADVCVVAEATAAADVPGGPSAGTVRLGRGPAITACDATVLADGDLAAALAAAAAAGGLPHQRRAGGGGGTDARAFQEAGVRAAVVSVPCRYLHTPASVVDPRDLRATAAVLAAWLARAWGGAR